jgi:very-short-patch-repair endonuclease
MRYNERDWGEIQKFYNTGVSTREVNKKFKINFDKAVKAGRLKSRTTSKNWDEIQRYYDTGASTREVEKKFKICFRKAVREGRLKSRTKSEAAKLSMDSGKLIPRNWSMIKGKSYPEKIFLNALIKHNISGWVCEYRNGRYRYDFAWPDLKIDVEIDGRQHLEPKVQSKDKIRDEFSRSQGWIVLRFQAKFVMQDVESCIRILKQALNPYIPII